MHPRAPQLWSDLQSNLEGQPPGAAVPFLSRLTQFMTQEHLMYTKSEYIGKESPAYCLESFLTRNSVEIQFNFTPLIAPWTTSNPHLETPGEGSGEARSRSTWALVSCSLSPGLSFLL